MWARGRGITGPYLNMRPHHGGVEVVGGRLGAGGALGVQNQVVWEEQDHLKLFPGALLSLAGDGTPWRQEGGTPICKTGRAPYGRGHRREAGSQSHALQT